MNLGQDSVICLKPCPTTSLGLVTIATLIEPDCLPQNRTSVPQKRPILPAPGASSCIAPHRRGTFLMKDHTPLDRTRSILDPIHGLIRFTDEEFRIIEHPVFQRLGKIKQNGLLYFVFPGATHTRFAH